MTAWAVEAAIASTILMLVVLALRGPVARYFGPHIAYGLWLLPALRLLLPPLPEAVTPAPLDMLPAAIDIEALLMAPLPVVARVEPGLDWSLLILGLWGAGAVSFLAWHLYRYWRFVKTAIGKATQLPRLDRDGVEVCASPVAGGPFAAGIFMKSVVLPEDYRKRYEKDELRLAIEHEIQHHRRGDMSANFVALVVLALHWWNPIAHWAHRAFRVDQELACDAVVLANATPAERHAYGSALLKSACDRLPVAACALGAGDDLKRRLKMMRVYRRNPARARIGSMIAAGLVGGGLVLTASNGIAAETTKTVEDKVRTTLLQPKVVPLPPAAPLPPEPLAAPVALKPPVAPLAPLPPAPAEPVNADDHADVDVDVDTDRAETSWIDHAEIARHASRAAAAGAGEAGDLVDHAEITREVAAELRREMPKMRLEIHRAVSEARTHTQTQMQATSRVCSAKHSVSARIDGEGRNHVVRCQGWTDRDRAEMRKAMIVSLNQARQNIKAMDRDILSRDRRERVLAELDRKLAALRATK